MDSRDNRPCPRDQKQLLLPGDIAVIPRIRVRRTRNAPPVAKLDIGEETVSVTRVTIQVGQV